MNDLKCETYANSNLLPNILHEGYNSRRGFFLGIFISVFGKDPFPNSRIFSNTGYEKNMSVEFLGVPLSHVPDAVNAFTSDNPDAVQSVRHTCTELKRARTSHGAKPHLVVYVRNLSDRAAWGLVSIRVRDTEQHRITVPTLIGNGVMQGKLFVLPMGELTLSNEEGYPDVSIEWLQLFTK